MRTEIKGKRMLTLLCRSEWYMDMSSIVQRVKVIPSERDGYVVVVQVLPFDGGEYRYEVEIHMVDAFIDRLDKMFKQTVEELIKKKIIKLNKLKTNKKFKENENVKSNDEKNESND